LKKPNSDNLPLSESHNQISLIEEQIISLALWTESTNSLKRANSTHFFEAWNI